MPAIETVLVEHLHGGDIANSILKSYSTLQVSRRITFTKASKRNYVANGAIELWKIKREMTESPS